jgi:hypothetical protein
LSRGFGDVYTRQELVTPVECGVTGRADDVDTRADLERIAGLAGPGGTGQAQD